MEPRLRIGGSCLAPANGSCKLTPTWRRSVEGAGSRVQEIGALTRALGYFHRWKSRGGRLATTGVEVLESRVLAVERRGAEVLPILEAAAERLQRTLSVADDKAVYDDETDIHFTDGTIAVGGFVVTAAATFTAAPDLRTVITIAATAGTFGVFYVLKRGVLSMQLQGVRKLAKELEAVIGRLRLVLRSARDYLGRVKQYWADQEAHLGDLVAEWNFTKEVVTGLETALIPWADDVLKRYNSQPSRRNS